MSGKTTNLELVHQKVPRDCCGKLTSIATEGDRTLFFDFMPLSLGKVAGMDTKFQLYTVPGQTFYESTRRLVLQGADGVVFVADSQKEKMDENIESFENLRRNLRENGLNIEEIPLVLQYNKRDLPDIAGVDAINEAINTNGWKHFEAVAVKGDGVMQTLKAVSEMVLENLNSRHQKTRRTSKTGLMAPDKAVEQLRPPISKAEAPREPELVGAAARSTQAERPVTERHAGGTEQSRTRPATRKIAAQGYTAAAQTPRARQPHAGTARMTTSILRNETFPKARGRKSNTALIAAVAAGGAAALIGLLLLLLA
jgi:hypothetical protein